MFQYPSRKLQNKAKKSIGVFEFSYIFFKLNNNSIIYTTNTTYKTNITYSTYITYLLYLQYLYLHCYNYSQCYLNLTFITYRNNIEDASYT